MSEHKSTASMPGSCGCPFCDEPACPDSSDNSYRCGGVDKLRVMRVDCVGMYCPVPVMQANEEIDQLEAGGLMELVADDPASAEDIPRWARRKGHRLVSMLEKDGEYRFLIQKQIEEE